MYDYSKTKYTKAHDSISIICRTHGQFTLSTAYMHLQGNGCPMCTASSGELLVASILRRKRIKYVAEATFKECRHIKPLHFDFAMYIKGKLGLIEYHGGQHFKSVPLWDDVGGGLALRIKRDRIKERYAAKKRIPFLILTYADSAREVSRKISSFIKQLKQGV